VRAVSVCLVLASPGFAADAPPRFPESAGVTAVQVACGPCHAVTIVTGARKTPAEWERTIEAMINRGARVADEDYETILAYLVRHFSPE
jgi:hypothetical protein